MDPLQPLALPALHFEAGRQGHEPLAIVAHTTVGTYDGTMSWFADPESRVSAHYLVALDGRLARFVDERDTARHAGRVLRPTARLIHEHEGVNPNLLTIGIEFEDGGRPYDVERPEVQYRVGARLIAEIAERWRIRLDRDHVIGHREVFSAKGCPGNLDVKRLVREALASR